MNLTDQDIPVPHGLVTVTGAAFEHIWSEWLPRDRTTKYRTCVIPGCPEIQHIEVKS